MSGQRWPVLVCDGERCAGKQTPAFEPAKWPWESLAGIRARVGGGQFKWTRRERKDLCPECSGWWDNPEELLAPAPRVRRPKSLEESYRDELRLAGLVT